MNSAGKSSHDHNVAYLHLAQWQTALTIVGGYFIIHDSFLRTTLLPLLWTMVSEWTDRLFFKGNTV